MTVFDTAAFLRLGNMENDTQLNKTEDICNLVIELSKNTLRSIKIFTPDLEHTIYNHDAFRINILNLARGNRHAQIQILVTDSSPAIQRGHQLIHLAKNLTSTLHIRQTPEDYQYTNMSFILIDQSTFLFKPDLSAQTMLQSACKIRGQKLHDFFSSIWELALPDTSSQSFHI